MPRPVTLVPASTLPESEHDDARRYWAERGYRKSYSTPMAYRTFIAQKVVAEHPKRVLELGPNVGLNLKTIRDLDPTIELVGVDVNPVAVARGIKDYGLDLIVVEDSIDWLIAQPDDSFDVAYTVSVIDHIAKPNETLKQLARVAKVLLLIEPWFGKEGKIRQEDISGTAPFSYSWNYPMRLSRYGMVTGEPEPHVISPDERTLGPDYLLYTARRKETLGLPPIAPAGAGTVTAPEEPREAQTEPDAPEPEAAPEQPKEQEAVEA